MSADFELHFKSEKTINLRIRIKDSIDGFVDRSFVRHLEYNLKIKSMGLKMAAWFGSARAGKIDTKVVIKT
jgi:hypothetical protein